MTLSSPSALAASTRPSLPPKSATEVASPAFTPDSVSAPPESFSGGAHEVSAPVRTSNAALAAAVSRRVFIAEPSYERAARRWRRHQSTVTKPGRRGERIDPVGNLTGEPHHRLRFR